MRLLTLSQDAEVGDREKHSLPGSSDKGNDWGDILEVFQEVWT